MVDLVHICVFCNKRYAQFSPAWTPGQYFCDERCSENWRLRSAMVSPGRHKITMPSKPKAAPNADFLPKAHSTASLIAKAKSVASNELSRLEQMSDRNGLDDDQIKSLQSLVTLLFKITAEEAEQAKAQEVDKMSDEELTAAAAQLLAGNTRKP